MKFGSVFLVDKASFINISFSIRVLIQFKLIFNRF